MKSMGYLLVLVAVLLLNTLEAQAQRFSGPRSGGIKPVPAGGGYAAYKCNWEPLINESQCSFEGTDTGRIVYNHSPYVSRNCNDNGSEVCSEHNIAGAWRRICTPKHEVHNGKNGAEIVLYERTHSCEGTYAVLQKNDRYFNCAYAEDYICRYGRIITN